MQDHSQICRRPYGYVAKLAYMVLTPATHSWGPLVMIDSTLYDKNNEWRSYGAAINQNSFAELWFQEQVNSSSVTNAYLQIYQFREDMVAPCVPKPIPVKWQIAGGDTLDEDPSLWVMQPGNDFVALSRPGVAGSYFFAPDSVEAYSFVQDPGDSLQFTGNPTVPVLSQTTVEDGRDHSATYDYAFTGGILNQYLTPEFENVTETLPGANGSISTSYYVHKDSTANGINYKFLEGFPYQVVDYNSSGSPVRSVENTWTAVGVDPTNGVFDQELLSKIDSLDGVKDTTTYSYDGAAGNFMVTEEIQSNGNGVERIIHMQHPLDYTTTSTGDAMSEALYNMINISNDISPVIEQWVVSDSLGSEYVASAHLTTYEVSTSGQILPYQSMRFFAEDPKTVSSFTPSTVDVSGTGISIFSYDSRYLTEETFNSYNQYGDPLETTDANGIATGYEYGYGGSTLMGVVKNSGGGPYLFDDFNDGSITDGDPFTWTTVNPGDWTVSNGVLVSNAGGYAANTNSSFQNFTADVRLQITNDGGSSYDWSALYFGSTSTNPWSSGYLVYMRYNGNVDLWSNATGVLATDSTGIPASSWRRLTVSVNGSNVEVFIDGHLGINYNLSSAPAAGYVALYTFYTATEFDDFRCYPYGGMTYSYGYDPVTLELTNKNGPNNIPAYYTYDSFQRLSTVQNDQNQVVRSLRYYLAGSSISYGNPNWTATTLYRDATDSTTTTTYFDGLGRNIQTLTQDGAEPMVSGIKYDQMNRDSVTYKPFLSSTGSGYVTGYLVDYYDQNYYNSNVYDGFSDSCPYSTNLYYPDPLGRIEDFVPPGAPWQSRPITYTYGTNPSKVNNYPAASLYRTTMTNENGVKKVEYKDKFGDLVQTIVDSGGPRLGSLNLTTNFTYDALGNMTQSISPDSDTTYHFYNTLCELTGKTTPDGGTTQYLYDNNGNLRFIKDADHDGATDPSSFANSSFMGPGSNTVQFTATMPTSVEIDLSTDMYFANDTETAVLETTSGTPLLTVSCNDNDGDMNSAITYLPAGTYACVITGNDPDGFNYDIYPTGDYEFVFRKYDAFNRLTQEGMYSGATASGDFTQPNADDDGLPNESGGYNAIFRRAYFYDTPSPDPNAIGQTNIIGRLSYTESYDVNGNLVERDSYSYDDMGRITWIVEAGPWSSYKRVSYSYNLQGQPTLKDYYDNANDAVYFGNYFTWNYYYDNSGRLSSISTSDQLEGDYSGTTSYQYFAAGNSQQLVLDSDVPATTTINYHYNQRNWLTSDSSADFWEQLGYDQSSQIGGTPEYNGNISYVNYYISGDAFTPSSPDMQDLSGLQPAPTNTMGYSYTYDGANRLTLASFEFQLDGEWGQAVSYGDTVAYDGNGNITGLTRYGDNATLNDNLTYSYRPGTDLDTLITNSAGTGAAYTFDSSGNVISNSRDSVGFILYDIYNHPVEVYDNNGDVIQYGYDANGARVEKEIGSSYNCYIRGKGGHTDVILLDLSSDNDIFNTIANGDNIAQVDWTNQLFSHYYYIKDHLGDVRMIIDENDNPQVWNNYYPFGEEMPGLNIVNAGPDDRYGFTSKELDAETGLYHLGARSYDPWSGRFLETDPLGDLSFGESPYSYSHDNPVEFSDPSGEYSYEINGVPVSNQVGQSFMSSADIGQYQLAQQARQYQEQNQVSQIIHNLSAGDQNLLTALGASEASASAASAKEIAGILFTVFNRLATGYGNAKSMSDVVYYSGAYNGINTAIFFYALNGYIPLTRNWGKGFESDWNRLGPAYIFNRFDYRISTVRNVLNGIINGSIQNPVGNSMFYHALNAGQWNTPPWDTYVRYLNAIYLTGGEATSPGWEQYLYGNTVFINWNGLK